MDRILCGVETEYGLAVEGRGADRQVDDAKALVRSYPGERLAFCWDYSLESPRADLRGFSLERLAQDPVDAQFDRGTRMESAAEIHSDLILPNGARFYNDHGHPEYSTPEAWSIREAALADKAGERIVSAAALAFERETGRRARIYKNNTDFHGASYGCHESFLAPRRLGFEGIFPALLPMLVARQVLTGAGKAGSESGASCRYQISQRADFFVEPANAETLYRRPIFNTRDEPHADPREWIRVHVISGDACMMASATARKLGLVKVALMLAEAGDSPVFRLSDPVRSFQQVSREPWGEGRIDLEGGSWTTPRQIIEAYLDQAEALFDLEPELSDLAFECRGLLEARFARPEAFAAQVDWAAKLALLETHLQGAGASWDDPVLQALDLAYGQIDPEEGLFEPLVEAGIVDEGPSSEEIEARLAACCEPTRALARGAAVRFGGFVESASWSSLVFRTPQGRKEAVLSPTALYSDELLSVETVEEFIELLANP